MYGYNLKIGIANFKFLCIYLQIVGCIKVWQPRVLIQEMPARYELPFHRLSDLIARKV